MSRPDAPPLPETAVRAAPGLASVAAGLAVVYGFVTDSLTVLTTALAALLLLIVVWLAVALFREGLTAENKLLGVCVVLAVGLIVVLPSYTSLPFWLVFGVATVVGVFVPRLLLDHTAYGTD